MILSAEQNITVLRGDDYFAPGEAIMLHRARGM